MLQRLPNLHFGFGKERVAKRLAFFTLGPFRQFRDMDALESPTMRCNNRFELIGRLRIRREETALPIPDSLKQELQRNRGLAAAGRALDEDQRPTRNAALQNRIEAGDAGGEAGRSDNAR